MKRLISLLIVLAMVLSLVPTTFAENSGVKITYDPSIFGFNMNIADISYENTSGFFSYHSRKDGWNPAHGDFRTNGATNTMGMVAHHHTAGDWYAIELNVPVAGDYDVSIQCVKRTYGSNKAYLYFLDSEEAKDIEANLTEENKFSENSFYDTGNYVKDEYANGTVTFAAPGKHLLVVQGTENWTYTSIGKIVLDGGNGTAVMGAVATISKTEISVGETSQADVRAYRSDGGEIMLYPDEKSFESSDESVVTIDANGVITALSEGDAKITATVSWDGAEYKSTASIRVVPKTSDVKIFYDFIDNFISDVPYTTGELTFLASHKQTNLVDTYDKTYGFWKLASAPSGLSVNHCYSTSNPRNNGFRAYFYNDKNWFAINIRVPVADTYDVILGYDVDNSFESDLKVHILDGIATDTEITESIANGSGVCGSVNCTKGKQDGTQKATLSATELPAGEHTVVFYAPNSKNVRLHSLALSAGSGEKSAIMSADMSLSPSGKLSVSGILSDDNMSAADM
ncbi:MAG: Ig-like domain-containing protein, partial [Oscillospiraceae bacterium]|nr:Ig-like domain-containing protein [Oscillospiraceae bacterium]